MTNAKGFTLIELIVAVGLFAVIMVLSAGAYYVIIGADRNAQSVSTGIDDVSFALEAMTRDIRTGYDYCGTDPGMPANPCPTDHSQFAFRDNGGTVTTYSFGSQSDGAGGTVGDIEKNGNPLTDPSINITSLAFYPQGTSPYSAGNDTEQARVFIIVSGTVAGGNVAAQQFDVETLATMRQSDI